MAVGPLAAVTSDTVSDVMQTRRGHPIDDNAWDGGMLLYATRSAVVHICTAILLT